VTIGGFSGPFRTRTWLEVDTALARAADERGAGPAVPAAVRPTSTVEARRVARSAVALHNNDRAGYWIAVDGVVYDVTGFRQIHPGGVDILDAHAGTDATAAFRRVGHHGSHRVTGLAARCRIGTLEPEPVLTVSDRELYRSWIDATYLVAEMENALRIDHALRVPGLLGLRHRSEIHERFRSTYLDAVTDEIADGLWRRTLAGCQPTGDPEWMRAELGRIRHSHRADALAADDLAADALAAGVRAVAAAAGPDGTLMAQRLEARIRRLERIDTALLAEVKQLLTAGARMMERDGVGQDTDLAAALRGLPPVVARYRGRVAAVLRTPG
jgi:sulfite reductase (NADPH) flavoprotein alpha-component